jgi:hypothetical protein
MVTTRKPGSDAAMKFVCDAPAKKAWFQIETEAEAEKESALMNHAVAKHFRRERESAAQSYKPTSTVSFERNIGLEAHIRRTMALFLTLRDGQGGGLVTAMLPPRGLDDPAFRIIVVGPSNNDPYPDHGAAIETLGVHYGLALDRARCFPYQR